MNDEQLFEKIYRPKFENRYGNLLTDIASQ